MDTVISVKIVTTTLSAVVGIHFVPATNVRPL